MRILLLTQWFQPEVMLKGLPFAKALAARGHDVEVVTGFPNYPGGTIYPGYRLRMHQKEMMDGISVHRVWLYPSHDRSALRRILNYCSFALSVLIFTPWIIKKKPDVIYVYNLVTLGAVAFMLRRLWGCRVLMDIQDLWPESVAGSGMMNNAFFLERLTRFCNRIYCGADALAVLSPGFKNNLIARGLSQEKVDVVYNWCDEESLARDVPGDVLRNDLALAGKFVVLFAGTMGAQQGLDAVLEAAALCLGRFPDVRFVLAGGGTEKDRLAKKAADKKLSNVIFLPFRPAEAMGEVFGLADALLVHLKDDPVFRVTIPSKTQAGLFMGRPLIMAVQGDAAELVAQAGAGVICRPEDPEDLVRAVGKLADLSADARKLLGEKARLFYEQRLSLQVGAAQFEEVFARIAVAAG